MIVEHSAKPPRRERGVDGISPIDHIVEEEFGHFDNRLGFVVTTAALLVVWVIVIAEARDELSLG